MGMMDQTDWARVPRECVGGCKLAEARALLAAAERLVGKTIGGKIVSQALWCDQGEHSFSARDPKAEHWDRQVTSPKTGEKETIPWDVCGKHVAAINERLAAMEAEMQHPIAPGRPAIPGSVQDS